MIHSPSSGEIITFYSYKGGTGRTMALSNVACLLAEHMSDGERVLMIDWDLEAPGLHRFFYDKFHRAFEKTDDSERALDGRPGLIDLFLKLDREIPKVSGNEEEVEKLSYEVLDRIKLDDFIIETSIQNLSLLKAGRFDENYSRKVNRFDWEELYKKSPSLIRLFAEKLAKQYKYILIDSRTGITDISGICTMLMPQKLVVVFTPNRQSYTGIEGLIRKATDYRKRSDDLRPLLVYPLPSRIEFSRDDLRHDWRFGNPIKNIKGYQPMFEVLFEKVYDIHGCNLNEYFEEVQIQQSPNYAYGEEIAVKVERTADRFSITRSYVTITEWLVNSTAPWQLTNDKIKPLINSAQQYYEKGLYTKAIDTWIEVLKIDPKNQIALTGFEKVNKTISNDQHTIYYTLRIIIKSAFAKYITISSFIYLTIQLYAIVFGKSIIVPESARMPTILIAIILITTYLAYELNSKLIEMLNSNATLAAFIGFLSVEIGTYYYPMTYNHLISVIIAMLVFVIAAIFNKRRE